MKNCIFFPGNEAWESLRPKKSGEGFPVREKFRAGNPYAKCLNLFAFLTEHRDSLQGKKSVKGFTAWKKYPYKPYNKKYKYK